MERGTTLCTGSEPPRPRSLARSTEGPETRRSELSARAASGLRATAQPLVLTLVWRVGPFWPHSGVSLSNTALRRPCGGSPFHLRLPRSAGFSQAGHPRGLTSGSERGEADEPPATRAAFHRPDHSPGVAAPASLRYSKQGSAERGRIWCGSAATRVEWSTEWAVTDGTGGTEGRRRHPTARATSL